MISPEELFERRSSEIEPGVRTYLKKPLEDVPLLRWIEEELERARHPNKARSLLWGLESVFGWRAGANRYGYVRDEIEEMLLDPGLSLLHCVASFRGWGNLSHDLELVASLVNEALRQRLQHEGLEQARFPACLAPDSPLRRSCSFPGWQFFDRAETDELLDAVRSLRAAEGGSREGLVLGADWDDLDRGWRTGRFDLALFRWGD